MDNNKDREAEVGMLSKKTNNTYTAKYIEGLIESSQELVDIMINKCGYTEKEVAEIIIGHKTLGKKEEALYRAMLRGDVLPTDSLNTIKNKMAKEMELSRQSWGTAFNNLIRAGKLTNG